MSQIFPYIVALVVCHLVYLVAQIPFALLTPIARRSPSLANYIGVITGYGVALLSAASLLLIPMTFPKLTLLLPAILRFSFDLNRWHRTYSALEETRPKKNCNYEGLERVTKFEQGSVWGGLLGYFVGAMTILKSNPLS